MVNTASIRTNKLPADNLHTILQKNCTYKVKTVRKTSSEHCDCKAKILNKIHSNKDQITVTLVLCS